MKERVKWLDVARFLGMFFIYLGHFHGSAGLAYSFVFKFHVPLFFFLSGCSQYISKDKGWKQTLIQCVRDILLPFWFFSLFALCMRCIEYNSAKELWSNLWCIAKGNIRTEYFAEALWFLTGLFVVKILFYALKKVLKRKWLLFIVCFVIFWVAERWLRKEAWVYNVNWSLYYMVFYAFGYCVYPWLKGLFAWDTAWKKWLTVIVGAITFVYATNLFFGENVLSFLNAVRALVAFREFLTATLVFFPVMLLAKLLENVTMLQKFGQNSLYLCGLEYVVKTLTSMSMRMFGLQVTLYNPLAVYVYVFALLCLANYLLTPFIKAALEKIKRGIAGLFTFKKREENMLKEDVEKQAESAL